MTFTPAERARYARHIMLKEIGGPGQQRLKAARAAIVGLGGLGAPAALYLAAAGIGALDLIDDDVVSDSNLQRQVIYRTEDLGRAKVEAAAAALSALNPFVTIHRAQTRLGPENAQALLAPATIVLDGADSFETRFCVNAACHALGRPLVSGAVGRWEGQVATFKSGLTRGRPIAARAPCYRCFVPDIPPEAERCALVGVVGALTGVIGSLMALEAIKEITGAGASLAGKIIAFDGLSGAQRVLRLSADPGCAVCGSSDA